MPITGAEGIGAAITPEEWSRYVLERLGHSSVVLRSGARRIPTTASVLHVPKFTRDGTADWYEELEPIREGSPGGDELQLIMKKVATSTVLSNEVVADASRGSIDSIGLELMKAVGLSIDRAIFVGAGPPKQPAGIVPQITQEIAGDVNDYDVIVDSIGQVTQWGGEPDSLYVNPLDWTEWLKVKDTTERPIVQPDVARQAAYQLVGLAVYSTPALSRGTAVIAEASQIVFANRKDASVEMSSDAMFLSDGTAARVIARCDVGLNDERGLCKVVPSSSQATEAKPATRKR